MRSIFLDGPIVAETVRPDRTGSAATVPSSVEVAVQSTAAVVGKLVGLGREQIDREGAFDEPNHARHHHVALGIGAPHGLAQIVATVCSITKGSFNQEFERLPGYSFPRNNGDCDI